MKYVPGRQINNSRDKNNPANKMMYLFIKATTMSQTVCYRFTNRWFKTCIYVQYN